MANELANRPHTPGLGKPSLPASGTTKQWFLKEIIGRLTEAYPDQPLSVGAQSLYFEGLAEIPGEITLAAVQDLIFNNPDYERFRPRVGAVKRRALEIQEEKRCIEQGINPETGHKLWLKK